MADYTEMSKDELLKAVLHTDYKENKALDVDINGVSCKIITFQEPYTNEYIVKEVESGVCKLYYKGLLQVCWMEHGKGKKDTGFITYKQGQAIRSEDWEGLCDKKQEHRYIINNEDGMEMVIKVGEDDGMIYRGGFDDLFSMKRNGKGLEFDKHDGRVLRYGVWKDDALYQVYQEFEDDKRMFEYKVTEGNSNADVWKREMIYDGGYVFDDTEEVYLRHGVGYVIKDGKAVMKGEWKNGKEVQGKSSELFDGWLFNVENRKDLVKRNKSIPLEIKSLNDWSSVVANVTEIVVASGCCNESNCTELDFSKYKRLKTFVIGDTCFMNVNELKLIGIERLEQVKIGINSFTKVKGGSGNDSKRHFYLKDCNRVRELIIGQHSFSDYTVCEIEKNPSLEVIAIGNMVNNASTNYNFYNSSFLLKNCSELRTVSFGREVFRYGRSVTFENLPELVSLQFGYYVFQYNSNYSDNILILKDLPKLTSLITLDYGGNVSQTFYYAKTITAENIPNLVNFYIYNKFPQAATKKVKKETIGVLASLL